MRDMMRSFAAVGAAMAMAGCGTAPVTSTSSQTTAPTAEERLETVLEGRWVWIRSSAGTASIVPANPSKYIVDFGAGGVLGVTADCSVGKGSYRSGAGLLVTSGISTAPAGCQHGSLRDRFLAQLSSARTMQLQDGLLYLAVGGGETMALSRDPDARAVDYTCPNKTRFTVVYHNRRAQLRYGGQTYALPPVPYGNGTRFTDGRVTLVSSAEDAQVIIGGAGVSGTCVAPPDSDWRPRG